jgi:hypothetical protein
MAKAKTADTSRISTTTLTDDPHLASIALAAGRIYSIEMLLNFDATVTAGMGIKFNLYYSGTYQNTTGPHGALNGTSVSAAAFSATTVSGTATIIIATDSTSPNGMIEIATLTLATVTGGNLSMQWAQNSSTAQNLNMRQGSYLRVIQVG